MTAHSNCKPTVLVMVAGYIPGYRSGGPLRSIFNLGEGLHQQIDFAILTSDRDLGDTKPYPNVNSKVWYGVGHARVRYLSPRDQSLRRIASAMQDTPHDLLYLNSFFSMRFTILPLIARRFGLLSRVPVILAPRGEFSEGALALKRPKKRAYILLARLTGLLHGIQWQASSQFEMADIRRVLGNNCGTIHVASDLATPPSAVLPDGKRDSDPKLHVAFVSRISPMKNLTYALETMAKISTPLHFNIYGPAEDTTYWARCEEIMAKMPSSVEISYHGAINPGEVAQVMRSNDVFFLPTLGENFGHVIAEALAVGTPVLISNATPWRNLEVLGLGHDIALDDQQRFIDVLEKYARMSPEEKMVQRQKTHAAAKRFWEASEDLETNRRMFHDVIARGSAVVDGDAAWPRE